jgi:hypothetical protein
MNHKPTRLDVITDLRRSIMASFSTEKFNDSNFKIFFKKAEINLKKINLKKEAYNLAAERLNKAKDSKQPIEKRREDLLMTSNLI